MRKFEHHPSDAALGVRIREALHNEGLEQITCTLGRPDWDKELKRLVGSRTAKVLEGYVHTMLSKLSWKPKTVEFCIRTEMKNFPIEGHEHDDSFEVFMRTWFGAPTFLKSGPCELNKTYHITTEWHAAPDTTEPRLFSVILCKHQ